MEGLISARYLWDVEAMTEAMAAHQRQSIRPVFRILLLLMMLFYVFLSVVIPILLILDSRSPPETRRNAAIALVFSFAIWGWLISGVRDMSFLRWRARKVFRSKPGGPEYVEWSIGPDEITNRTSNSASTILWPLFMKVVEAPRGFMLYHSIQHFNWIPGHAFASEGEMRRFAELARMKVTNYVVLGECRFPAKPEPVGLDEL